MTTVTARNLLGANGYEAPADSDVSLPEPHLRDALACDTRKERRHVAALVTLADGTRALAARAWPVAGSVAEIEVWAPSSALLALLGRRTAS